MSDALGHAIAGLATAADGSIQGWMELFGDENDWQSRSGYGSWLNTGFEILRRLAGRIVSTSEVLAVELAQARSEYLAWVLTDPDASVYINESREAADEELAVAGDETLVLLFGSLVAYGFALLETALRECVETAAAVRGAPAPRGVRGARIEGWLSVLDDAYDVHVDWTPQASGIQAWRAARNQYVHQLEVGEVPQAENSSNAPGDLSRIDEFLALLEDALTEIDDAMTKL